MATSKKLEVWVVDDDQSVRWVLEKALRQADMQTRSFERGEHLLDAIAKDTPPTRVEHSNTCRNRSMSTRR